MKRVLCGRRQTGKTLAAFAVALVCGSPGTSQQQSASDQDRVRAEFARICERERLSSEFFGSPRRERLARAEAGAASRLQSHVALAQDSIRLGRFEQAQGDLTDALRLIDSEEFTADPEQKRRMAAGAHLLRGVSHVLAAEDANCLAFHNAASCILPIRPAAVHRDREPIRAAIKDLERAAELEPDNPESVWFLNLAHMLAGTYPEGVPARVRIPAERFQPKASQSALPRMHNVAPVLGVDVRDLAGGAILDDFDGDGLLDLISSSWDPCSSLRAFRSNGQGGFDDVTEAWQLDGQLGGLNLIHADADNDGDLDLLVLRGAWNGRRGQVRNSLLLNQLAQEGGFVDVTYAAGLAHPAYPTQAAAFADIDGDGDLDLFVGNESPSTSIDFLSFDPAQGRPYPSQLFENTGLREGVPIFSDIARRAGVTNLRFAKGVAFGDVDNDGDEDLFVSNIGPNRLYINQSRPGGAIQFTDRAVEWGVSEDERTFAAWFFDMDNDGDLDLFNADYSAPTAAVAASIIGRAIETGQPRLYRNDGDRFTEVSRETGLDVPALPMGANYGDLDGDGFEDIYLGTGLPAYTAIHPNLFYRNHGGKRFVDATFATGLGHLQKGHGVAFGDLDHDGDLDLFEQLGGAYPYDEYSNALYLNPSNDQRESGHRFLHIELAGSRANQFALGARVQVDVLDEPNGSTRSILRQVSSGGSFGGSSFRLEIGLGAAERISAVKIRWPGEREWELLDASAFALDGQFRVVQAPQAGDPSTVRALQRPRIQFSPRNVSASATTHDH